MAIPTFTSITPASGLLAGGELLELVGTGLAPRIRVSFEGEASPEILGVSSDGTYALLRAPAGSAGAADLLIENLDASGDPVPGESVAAAAAYSYELPDLGEEAPLTRIVRAMLRRMKAIVPPEASGPEGIAVDYDDSPADGLRVLHFASVPGLALAGPNLEENLFYRRPDRRYEDLAGFEGERFLVRGPSKTYDLIFTLNAAARSKVAALNLLSAAAASLHRSGRLSMLRVAGDPAGGLVNWNLNVGGARFSPPRDGVHVAALYLRVVGFNLDEGFELARARIVDVTELNADAL